MRSLISFNSRLLRQVLLLWGRIHPRKGLSETLRAFARVLQMEPKIRQDWFFVIAGWDDGGYVAGLRRLTQELGLSDSVLFARPVFGADKNNRFGEASALILASHSEGLPMAVLQARAHRYPVLMTDACNLPEGFAKTAAVRIPTDPAAMGPILKSSLEDPNLCRLGLAGRKLVEEQFSWERIGQSFASLYLWLCGRGSQPSFVDAI